MLGFDSNKDKSLSGINFPEIQEGDKNFLGYVGHGIFRAKDRTLVRIIPIYQPSHPNQVRPAEQENWFMVYTREKRYEYSIVFIQLSVGVYRFN